MFLHLLTLKRAPKDVRADELRMAPINEGPEPPGFLEGVEDQTQCLVRGFRTLPANVAAWSRPHTELSIS